MYGLVHHLIETAWDKFKSVYLQVFNKKSIYVCVLRSKKNKLSRPLEISILYWSWPHEYADDQIKKKNKQQGWMYGLVPHLIETA